jgi:rhodanese-related sulfurtransferase
VLAVKAVEVLQAKGFKIVRLEDGVPDWRARGFKVAVGDDSQWNGLCLSMKG